MADLHRLAVDVLGRLGHASPFLLVAAILLHLLKVAVEALVWHGILAQAVDESPRPRCLTTLCTFIGATGAGAILPARMGEGIRVGLARRYIPGSNAATLSATVLVEVMLEMIFAAGAIGAVAI